MTAPADLPLHDGPEAEGAWQRLGPAAGFVLVRVKRQHLPFAGLLVGSFVLHGLAMLGVALFDRATEPTPTKAIEIPVEVVVAPPPAPPPPQAAAKPADPPAATSPAKPETQKAQENPKAENQKPQQDQKPPTPNTPTPERAQTAPQPEPPGMKAATSGSESSPFGPLPGSFRAVVLPPASRDGELAVNYRAVVFSQLAKAKHYPDAARARGAAGSAVVAFQLDQAGNPSGVSLARSSGDPDLDAEVVAMVTRAAPFPAPPAGAQRSFAVGIEFGRDN